MNHTIYGHEQNSLLL